MDKSIGVIVSMVAVLFGAGFALYSIFKNKPIEYQVENSLRKKQHCAICLEEDTKQFVALECSHVFHEVCIGRMIASKSFFEDKLCPICRNPTNFY